MRGNSRSLQRERVVRVGEAEPNLVEAGKGSALADGVEPRSDSSQAAEWSNLYIPALWKGERMKGCSSTLRFPLYLAPAYVAAAKAAREIDGVHCRIGACLRLCHIAAERSYIEEAAAIGNELAVPDCGSGMEHTRAVAFGRIDSADSAALVGCPRIAVTRHAPPEERRAGKDRASTCRSGWS